MVKANVDMILDVLRRQKTVTVNDLSRELSLPKEDILKSADYLEDDGVVKVENKFPNTVITFLKDPDVQVQPAAAPAAPQPRHEEQASNAFADQPKETRPVPETKEEHFSFILNEPMNRNIYVDPEQQPAPQVQQQYSQSPQPMFTQQQAFSQPPVPKQTFDRPAPMDRDFVMPDSNPLEKKPDFDLSTPEPTEQLTPKKEIVDEYVEDYAPTSDSHEDYTSFGGPSMDRIDGMVDLANKKISNHEYKHINVLYRKIYNLFSESEDLSPNERTLLAERINDLFRRIKRTYLIESSAV